MLAISQAGGKIFRNNTGSAWIGKSYVAPRAMTVNLNKGDVVVYQGRFFNAGLCVGSSDLIGLKPVKITPEMVGITIAVFVACEAKKPGGKASAEQIAFLEMVNEAGGIGFIATSEDEAIKFLNWKI